MGLADQPIEKTGQVATAASKEVGDYLLARIEREAPGLAGAIAQAIGQSMAAALSGVASEIKDALAELRTMADSAPATIASTASKVLDEANGLTLSTTIVITNTLTRKPQ